MEFSPIFWLLLILAVIFLAVLWWLPAWQAKRAARDLHDTEVPMAENEFRKTIAQVIGGVVVLCGLYFTYDQAVTAKEHFQQELLDSRFRFSQEMQQSREQFRKTLNRASLSQALQQLGTKNNAAVRLGALLTFRQLLKSEPEDSRLIAQILATFIKENATTARKAELEAAFTALASRPIMTQPALQQDVDDLDLRGIRIDKLTLRGGIQAPVNLSGLDLEDARIISLRAGSARLDDSDLSGAIIRDSDLSNASFRATDLQDTCFVKVMLDVASFDKAVLTGAKFCDTNIDAILPHLSEPQIGQFCVFTKEGNHQTLPIKQVPPNPRAPQICKPSDCEHCTSAK
jgi:uncharacterized protein YjbI with pentapeptide repeats